MEFIEAKTIVTNATSNRNYMAFDYVMNIYRGCSHGCIYCYARSNYYEKNGNFDIVRAKKNALEIIRNDLRRKIETGIVLTSGMSDPYNPQEKEYKLTRNALELINAFSFGICIFTKSNLVTRDTDILQDIKEHSPVNISFSITCYDDDTSKKIEPFAAATSERFKAIEHFANNGLISGVLLDPMLPYITDTKENVLEMVKKAKYHGAKYIYLATEVTMADIQREYFLQEAEKLYPRISEKYKERFKNYYHCRSPHQRKLQAIFAEECEKERIVYDMRAINQMISHGYKKQKR